MPPIIAKEIFAASIFSDVSGGQRLQQNSVRTLPTAALDSSASSFQTYIPNADHPIAYAARNERRPSLSVSSLSCSETGLADLISFLSSPLSFTSLFTVTCLFHWTLSPPTWTQRGLVLRDRRTWPCHYGKRILCIVGLKKTFRTRKPSCRWQTRATRK